MNNRSTGLRKTTRNSLSAQQFSRKYREGAGGKITRTQALQVAKRAASALGLKSAKIALIDQLFASSKACDWSEDGSSPIVWPSNERLARGMGVSVSTMKHHLKGLVHAGLIAYSDHPTYQRRGRRDDQGRIVEGYGIDLSPIAVRYDDLSEIADAADYQARLRRELSYRRTVLRKEIESLIASARTMLGGSLTPEWQAFQARLDHLRGLSAADTEEFTDLIAEFEQLRTEIEGAFDLLSDDVNFDTALSKFRPLQTTAEHSTSEPCKDERHRANARYSNSSSAFGAMAFESKAPASSVLKQVEPADAQDDIRNISLSLIQSACPNVAEMVPDAFTNWMSLRGSGALLCRLATINPQVWQEAQHVLGVDMAIAAMTLIVERSCNGSVKNPGGYLRALVQRGRSGRLHISRSLFALANETTGKSVQ
jgi:replication initiation protein RepC